MKKTLHLNPQASYLKNNESYVFYLNFNYFFFTGISAKLMSNILPYLQNTDESYDVPNSFIDYLKEKNIVLEVL